MTIQKVHPSAGLRVRIHYKNCDGENVLRSDIGSAKYTVWNINELTKKRLAAVTGHEGVTIPENAFETSVQTDAETSKTYTFSYTISAQTTPPFPNVGNWYEVEIVVTDSAGEPHADSILCRSSNQ